MTLLVEDGTGVDGAESYISVADADAYFSARGNAAWAALDTGAKEAALRNACDYMGAQYGQRWVGDRATATQSLDWPRANVPDKNAPKGDTSAVVFGPAYGYYAGVSGLLAPVTPMLPSNVVPQAVSRANAELAVRASAGDLMADQGAQVTRETVGPVTVDYLPGGRQSVRYAFVDGLLGPFLLDGSPGSVAVVRT